MSNMMQIAADNDLDLYLRLFKGRDDCFAQQGEDFYSPVRRVLDEFYVRRHLDGDLTFGVYVLTSESRCHLICVDIDIPKSELDQVDFANPEQKYAYLKGQLDAILDALVSRFNVPSDSILVEETGGRGYHIWVFFDGSVNGQTAVKFGVALKAQLGFEIEFFPKQGRLAPQRKYGNLIKLPLGIHRKYGARSSFLVVTPDGVEAIAGTVENLARLRAVTPMSADAFETSVAAIEEELPLREEPISHVFVSAGQRQQFEGDPWSFIRRCTAMQNLRAKAESGTRFSHSEAFHFADVMLSVAGGAEVVHDTMRHALGGDYDQHRTQDEIERIAPLHPPNCLTLVRKGICPGYCKESVRRRNEDPLTPGTTPCSVWLRRKRPSPVADVENLLERIGTAENVKRAFFQLRQYHEHEDALFFDPFDFEQFERDLDANCSVFAAALLSRLELPFLGYMPVKLPKKIDEDRQLVYRCMSYSTVYDQAPIQAVFNPVALVVESVFQPTSYGYRWNTDPSSPYRIFEDWREAYPRFRNEIMAAMKRHPNGFHVCCDIKGYYDHVDHSILLEQLRNLIPYAYVYQSIERTVRAYSSVAGQGYGLPQGPAYARLLANLYLNEFDIFAGQVAAAYFRYVDDFVLVFETEHEAEEAVEEIVRYLADLGLELSQDEAKRAVVTPNTDLSRVRKTLDKIHYGILEGTRHVEHLAPQAVADFMQAVQRHSVSPVNLDELIQINDALPSLLYVVSQKTLFPHELQPRIVEIVEFLIRHKWFCPKKLKTIFYRLLDLEPDEDRLYSLSAEMDPVHRVYFLLSVFGSWQSRTEHQTLLKRLVEDGLKDDHPIVSGFALAITSKLGLKVDAVVDHQKLIERLSATDHLFSLLKWLPTVDYLALTDDVRAAIRDVIGRRSPDLVRMLLLSGMTALPRMYVDTVYVAGLLAECSVLLLPAACDLMVAATDRGEVFDSLSRLITSQLELKPLAIAFVSQRLFQKRAAAGLGEIENLKLLYAHIPDEELKQCMIGGLSRIMQYGLACDEEFAKQHRELARYNECFLFEMMGEGARYDYLELIPEARLRANIDGDLDRFRATVDDFGAKGILPRCSVFYDSGKGELRLEYKTEGRYRQIDPKAFSLTDQSVLDACLLASEVYRKATYFRRLTGKAPDLSPENLLVDSANGSVVIRTVGRSLCALHVVEGAAVGDEEADIARMLAALLEALVLKSRSAAAKFLKESYHPGIKAFLCLFIRRLKSKEPGRRFSCARFEYLVNQLRQVARPEASPLRLEIVYLRERLKGALFRYNSSSLTWQGVCRALDDHLSSHLRAVCSRDALRDFPFRSRLMFADYGRRQLHVVAKSLLNLALCRADFRSVEQSNAAYLDLLELLLLYASVCLEIVALARSVRRGDGLQELASSPILSSDLVRVRAGDYDTEVAAEDIAALVIQQPKKKTDEPTVGLSLRQLSLLALFGCNTRIENDTITVEKPERVGTEAFRAFAHACLVRIPIVDSSVASTLDELFSTLRSNEDFGRLTCLEEIRDAIHILYRDLRRVRSDFGLVRVSGRADGTYFPPDVRCRRWFRKARRVKEYALPGCALTNSFPSSRRGYPCSWDVKNRTVVNLMIPGEGLHSLLEDLTKSKVFGFKLSYLYSARLMVIWDTAGVFVTGLALAFCEDAKRSVAAGTTAKGVCSVLTYILGATVVAFFSKLFLYDLRYWSERHRRFVGFVMKRFLESRAEHEE